MTTPYPVKYIDRKKYYRVPQSQAIAADGGVYIADDACQGCVFNVGNKEKPCVEHRDARLVYKPVLCQDYEVRWDSPSDYVKGKYEDYDVTKDYIFIPATRKGIADYVAHLLEAS